MKQLSKTPKSKLKIGDFSLTEDEVFLVADAEVGNKGLVHHHITSANELYEIGIPQIITHVFKVELRIDDNIRRNTEEEKNIDYITIEINFTKASVGHPIIRNYDTGKNEMAYPHMVMSKEKTYKSPLNVDAHIKATAYLKNGTNTVREEIVENFQLCMIPIMVKSKYCNTWGLSKEALVKLKEDPTDTGGYFIIKGIEWVIDGVENILFNQVRIFKNEGYGKEVFRAEYISKPGDFYLNSDLFIVRWLNDDQLTVEIKRDKLKDLHIPFYLLFRILGWGNDREIFDNIMLTDDSISKNIYNFLVSAMNAKYAHLTDGQFIYTQGEALEYFAKEMAPQFEYLNLDEHPENYQHIIQYILNHIDLHFLQHMGTSPEDRPKKLRFLCLIIRKIFLVKLGVLEPTDRDSYNSKRIHAAGTSYAKVYKTFFNASIIQQIKRKFKKDFKAMSFFQIELGASFKSSIYSTDFERSITQAITAGNKSSITVNKKARINRLSSQLLNHKNQLNVMSTLRGISAPTSESSKQSERANKMRRVHMSFLGFICVVHSPEGEKVGINKQLALTATITTASSSEVIKDILLSDDDVSHLDETTFSDIGELNLSNVYVNGQWIGCCMNALDLVIKYRQLRREFKISPETTIAWDVIQNEVYFWTDVGRMLRPLLIVYNNVRDADKFPPGDYKKRGFRQGLGLTKEHITKLYSQKITIQDLLKENVIEYISPEEQENMYLAASFEILKKDEKEELREYTHCDIPQSMLGITALTSPFSNHNQIARIIFQTSQSKQTCGVFALNWPFRADKDTFLQYNCETPLVKTLSNRYLFPNGSNAIVAIQIYGGWNQEDSLIFSEGAVKRGFWNGCKFTFYKTELDQREEFGNPDVTNTTDIKSACYDKLKNGIIQKGVIVHKGDALIGKYVKLSKNTEDGYLYADRSIIYKDEESAIVHNVIIDRNEDDEKFCKVVLRKLRPVQVGDKYSSRAGQKGIVGILMKDADMPMTEEGMRPSIIVNPHAIPSRMTIGQLFESQVGNWAASKGTQTDATIFRKVDIESIATELEDLGMNRYGYHRLYSGITGEFIDTMIFMGPTFYQRLQKFVIDTVYSINTGPSDVLTLRIIAEVENKIFASRCAILRYFQIPGISRIPIIL